ncbi:Coenzyme F420 hydrogenase/dehydrogenase, beta subunit C-terminal domain [Methanoculleus bourgensis]|uniref:Coenzyme F420 hydrogenase/dehydrogenase, beta subunit C-terminal domain n=1 Tax=Methanoculleus bourgensis TaxID=83986 RepID=UPI001BDA4F85|nr:Coenzyme F420 hydrogenase/dehydrogenase, beta subunit C-terminal domain [Methanoculleus bourgensis]MBT0733035.1 Coenzyme F420 hydrogenase/dehydrogenase, beta subunit C-terminal domain [Methanoculleus bourgensis]
MKSHVSAGVVSTNLCIGCGLCAALCPQDILAMQWNQYGEYNPVEVSPCTTECGLCLKVCPFAGSGENEDTIGERLYGAVPGIQHRSEIGYYLASYVGYSERHRPTSASGGMATWLLEALLAEGIVDHVICVAPTSDPERLFAFQVFDTPEDMRTGAGSAYYPVELSGVIRRVLEVPGRYAVTGLPCFLKAIRLAQQRNKKLRERIVVTVGLTCGQLKSRHFTDYVAALAGVQGEVTAVRYRGKSPDQPASNYHYVFTAADGEEQRIFWNEGISEAWTNRWFTPRACSYCDDVFAECADVTCMDAWLPEYSQDSRGTSLVLVRSPAVREVLERGQGISLDPIPVERVIQSQAGVVAIKRQHLACRLYLDPQGVPEKRVAPERPKNPFLRQEVVLKERMRVLSRDRWGAGERDGKHLREAMGQDLRRLTAGRQISKIITFPVRTLRYIRRKVGGNNHG